MRSLHVCLLLAALVALAHAFPGASRPESSDSSEVEDKNDGVFLRGLFDDMDETEEPSMPGFWRPFRFDSSPFEGLFTRMQETMNRIRAEMAAALAERLGQGGLTPWGKIPEGANTTSTTKIIGDHKVTINETTYSDGDDNSGTVFRVRVIDVKPLNETPESVGAESPDSAEDDATTTTTTTKEAPRRGNVEPEELTTQQSSRSVETVEEFDNEIPKNQVDVLTA